MPCFSDKLRIPKNLDRRRKLSDEEKDEIREKYKTGTTSHRRLAKEYNVSQKSIFLIVNPEGREKEREYQKLHWKDKYDKVKHNESIRKTRAYKLKLYQEGKITKN